VQPPSLAAAFPHLLPSQASAPGPSSPPQTAAPGTAASVLQATAAMAARRAAAASSSSSSSSSSSLVSSSALQGPAPAAHPGTHQAFHQRDHSAAGLAERILVNRLRQAKNPIVGLIRAARTELVDDLVPDFLLGPSAAALFVQVNLRGLC